MSFKNEYLKGVMDQVIARNPGEPLFHQAVEEVLLSLEPVVEMRPELQELAVIERIVEPERMVSFRVSWVDDNGKVQVNRGFRVQHSSAIGPYKGGLRFDPSVTADVVKFLAFEQCFKNSLTTLPMGGGKGGSDFSPFVELADGTKKPRSDGEIMRFCQSFMTELYRHIGSHVDVPAGDKGVGAKEIGYLYGQYKRIVNNFENAVLTGKGRSFGGSILRPEATGYGATYFCDELLKKWGEKDGVKGKTFALSAHGNVAWGAALKITELGGKVVTVSSLDGYVYAENGLTKEMIDYLPELRAASPLAVKPLAEKFDGLKFVEGKKPWEVKADVLMPCATENEVRIEDAKNIVANGVKYYVEVSNMPTTKDAVELLLENGVVVAPSKAVNAGGVAVSGLEMSQNSLRLSWSAEEVDEKLKTIMSSIFNAAYDTAEKYGKKGDLIMGANIAGFEKIADAMIAQGIV